jgi:hypothetical protein
MEAIRSSETSVYTRSTRRQIQEDEILHSHRRKNLKSCICILFGIVFVNELRHGESERECHFFLYNRKLFSVRLLLTVYSKPRVVVKHFFNTKHDLLNETIAGKFLVLLLRA